MDDMLLYIRAMTHIITLDEQHTPIFMRAWLRSIYFGMGIHDDEKFDDLRGIILIIMAAGIELLNQNIVNADEIEGQFSSDKLPDNPSLVLRAFGSVYIEPTKSVPSFKQIKEAQIRAVAPASFAVCFGICSRVKKVVTFGTEMGLEGRSIMNMGDILDKERKKNMPLPAPLYEENIHYGVLVAAELIKAASKDGAKVAIKNHISEMEYYTKMENIMPDNISCIEIYGSINGKSVILFSSSKLIKDPHKYFYLYDMRNYARHEMMGDLSAIHYAINMLDVPRNFDNKNIVNMFKTKLFALFYELVSVSASKVSDIASLCGKNDYYYYTDSHISIRLALSLGVKTVDIDGNLYEVPESLEKQATDEDFVSGALPNIKNIKTVLFTNKKAFEFVNNKKINNSVYARLVMYI